MPPVSIVIVWQAAMMASGIANRIVLATQSGVTIPGCTICSTMTSSAEQQEQRDERAVAHPGARHGERGLLRGRWPPRRSCVLRRSVTYAPSMTTTTMITPWMTVENAGSTPRKSRSARIRPRMKMPMIGPSRPPRPPARLTPPSTMAATLRSRYGPGTGCADAGARGQRQATERGEEAGECVRDDLRPRHVHAAAEGRQLVRADGVQRQPEPRPPQRDPDQRRR